MNEEREKVYQILELGKHIKNLHHKKGFGGLLFIDLSMIKFSKLSSYIRQLDKENLRLKDNWNIIKQEILKIRQLTFTKYNSNEWENCLSFNDDIEPILDKMKELEGSDSNE